MYEEKIQINKIGLYAVLYCIILYLKTRVITTKNSEAVQAKKTRQTLRDNK